MESINARLLNTAAAPAGLARMINAAAAPWFIAIFICVAAGLAAILVTFVLYYVSTKRELADSEKARREAERANLAKNEFLSNVGHDIRTSMNGIVGMAAIANANLGNERQVRSCLKKITLTSRHLLGLIADVDDLSKIESGMLKLRPDDISLPEIVRNIAGIVRTQASAKNQRFEIYAEDISAERLHCDGVRLGQLLLNLLDNAVKFTPEGGRIELSLREEPAPADGKVRLRFGVKDDGIGMADELKAHIFEAYTHADVPETKRESAGLGLAIAKHIVDAMNGTISAESAPGRGSDFRVVLDLDVSPEDRAPDPLPGWEVLVVTEDPRLAKETASALRAVGCRAETAADGEAAHAAVAARRQSNTDYRALLIDAELAFKDNYALVRALLKESGETSVPVLLRSHDWNGSDEGAEEAGVAANVQKPAFRSELSAVLKAHCDETRVPPKTEEMGGVDFHGKRILLAEDNDLNREIAEELLSDLGLVIESAENGKICADMFENSDIGYYQAILMDLRMPVMTGYEATEAIRAMNRPDAGKIPIIAMSADTSAEDVKRCLDCGMDAHTAKPVDMDVVSDVLQKFIGTK